MRYIEPSTEAELLKVYEAAELDERISAVCDYLDRGIMILRGFGTFEHPALDGPQPIGQATDGVWVWPLVAPRLFEARAAWPSPELVAHVLSAGAPPASLDDETIADAIQVATKG